MNDICDDPSCELVAAHFAGGETENDYLLIIYRIGNFKAVERQEIFHRMVTDAFIAINKRVVFDE